MNREEFLRSLRAELSQNVSEQIIGEQLSYYSTYISEQVAAGQSEDDVIESLGAPRLLARTIIEAAEAAGDTVANESPFRYTEEKINRNSDEEDLQYTGAAADSGTSQDSYHVNNGEDSGPFDWARRRAEGFRETFTDGSGAESEHAAGRRTDAYGDSVSSQQEQGFPGSSPFRGGRIYTTSGWGCIAAVVVFFLVLHLIGMILGGVFSLLASPALLPVLVVLVILWFMKGMMDR